MANYFLDAAVVDDAVERVAHLVRNGRVDEGEHLTLRLRGVVQDLLTDIDEAYHALFDLLIDQAAFLLDALLDCDPASVDFEELEGRDVLVFNALHAR